MNETIREFETRDPARELAREVLIHGPIARGELGRRLGLSPASLTRLSRPFLDHGILVEGQERQDGAVGRPVKPLDVRVDAQRMLGVKITGEHVFGVVTDLRATVLDSVTVRLDSRDPDSVADTIAEVARSLSARVDSVTALGVGIGGLVGEHGLVRSAPFLEWSDVPLGTMLEERTELPTVIDNDLVAFTEYEHWFGAGRGVDDFAVLTLGAGIGFGLVIHDEIVVSDDSGIGLVGHWPLDPFGPVCPSGHRGCAKSVLEQGAIVATVSAALGRSVSYDDAMTLAAAGEPAARRLVDDAGRGLGTLLAAIANLTTPRLIVLGGEGVGLVEVAHDAIQEGIAQHRDPRATPLTLVSTPGDNTEWCRGAAVLAIQRYVLDR